MDTKQLNEQLDQGFEVLKPQLDKKSGMYRIVKWARTKWRSYGSGAVHFSESEARETIERIVQSLPNNYKKYENEKLV